MPRAERLAFICPRFAEGSVTGGAETLIKALALRAGQAGREVVFLTTCATNHFTWKNEAPPGERIIDGLRVRFFPVDDDRDIESFLRIQAVISRKGSVSQTDEQTWIANSVNSRALCQHLKDEGRRFDRIVIGPYLFGLTHTAAGVHPHKTLLVPCLHDEGFAYLNLFRDLFNQVSGCMFNSEPERDLARRLYALPRERCAVVGMGLNPFEADPNAFSRRHQMQAPYVIYSGRREVGKGTPLLMDYLALFRERTGRDVKLVLTGSGEIRPPPELAPHIMDLGFVPEPDKHEAMAGAIAFCHPSTLESFSIVLLESWLAQTPALVHAQCDVTRFHCQASGGGLWFRVYPEFEEALMGLMDHASLRKAMGLAGHRYALREYSWDAIDAKLFATLDL